MRGQRFDQLNFRTFEILFAVSFVFEMLFTLHAGDISSIWQLQFWLHEG